MALANFAALRTRFAPTPSGYLHLGNAWSFLLTWLTARVRCGRIHLRIDDLDAARFREEYLEDIFASLAWLGLDYDSGPLDPADFHARHSQRLRMDAYRAALDRLLAVETGGSRLVYACACSREQARLAAEKAGAPGLYSGTCRFAALDRAHPRHSLRLRVSADASVALREENAGLLKPQPARDMGDFVLWQSNGDPAYQLASVVDDEALGVNFVARGLDLLPSTGAQLLLARHLELKHFPHARFLHHGLLLGRNGTKLSKSTGDVSLKTLRARLGGPEAVYRFFAGCLGMETRGKNGPADLLAEFAVERIPDGPIYWEDFLRQMAG